MKRLNIFFSLTYNEREPRSRNVRERALRVALSLTLRLHFGVLNRFAGELLHAENRQSLGAMRAQDENALNIAGA